MGNRSARPHRFSHSIVPNQDPLLKSFARRIVHSELSRDFETLPQVLGTGYSGAVRLAAHRTTGQQVAVKEFNKKRLKANRVKLLQSEVEVHLRLDHPNICRLLHAYEGKQHVWLVMELCDCELYKRLCERKVYGEEDAREVMLQMLQAMNYLHTQNIVHRDLKLENWMYGFTDADERDRLKLIDFGFSRRLVGADQTLDMPCGTLHYTSPEVLAQKYTRQCDMWSLGVIGYMLLLGKTPFRGSNTRKIMAAIRSGTFPKDGNWKLLSHNAQDFIANLLRTEESKRMDAARALEHPWMASMSSSSSDTCRPECENLIGCGTLRSLRKFAQGSHLRRAALTVLAYSLTSRELQDLEQTFLAFDRSKQGTVTMEQLAEVMREHHMEMSNEELKRIFESVDFEPHEEIHYTPFVAAMLATRISLHEDKVRSAFDAFDDNGTGYITAGTLAKVFNKLENKSGSLALTQEDAENWIREVDYKGNGVIDFDTFFKALKGEHIWAFPAEGEEEHPEVRIYTLGARSRSFTDHDILATRSKSIRHRFAYAIIDDKSIVEEQRSKSFNFGSHRADSCHFGNLGSPIVGVRDLCCEVDEKYFLPQS